MFLKGIIKYFPPPPVALFCVALGTTPPQKEKKLKRESQNPYRAFGIKSFYFKVDLSLKKKEMNGGVGAPL